MTSFLLFLLIGTPIPSLVSLPRDNLFEVILSPCPEEKTVLPIPVYLKGKQKGKRAGVPNVHMFDLRQPEFSQNSQRRPKTPNTKLPTVTHQIRSKLCQLWSIKRISRLLLCAPNSRRVQSRKHENSLRKRLSHFSSQKED